MEKTSSQMGIENKEYNSLEDVTLDLGDKTGNSSFFIAKIDDLINWGRKYS